jgi:hypothetical protein
MNTTMIDNPEQAGEIAGRRAGQMRQRETPCSRCRGGQLSSVQLFQPS